MEIAKEGDIIEWTLPDRFKEIFGKTVFQAKVVAVFLETKEYGVYAEYGQDIIPFSDALKITK